MAKGKKAKIIPQEKLIEKRALKEYKRAIGEKCAIPDFYTEEMNRIKERELKQKRDRRKKER